ncbi:hypothetical protein [Anaerostipes sp.]|uniref:hypothetical protein n=1 Tax=Anaerostipes sp. TaxID=1872530 RepID=UPI0025B7D2AE|nr:hypothetical protein [Anaerostipes sp.]MBS7009403.1 hypothetical protein [Anaerostipes sp.]
MKNIKIIAVFCLIILCLTGCSRNVTKKEMTVSFFDKDLKGRFTGTLKDKKPQGKGSFQYKNGKQYLYYKGDFNKGAPSGKGYLKTNLCKVTFGITETTGNYQGETLDGKLSGKGEYRALTPSDLKSTYTGYWKDNLAEGQGELVFDNKKYFKESGTFTEGSFTPNFLELFNNLGAEKDLPFSVCYKAQDFLLYNEELFPAKSIGKIKHKLDSSVKLSEILKNPEQYGDKIVKLPKYYVVDSYTFTSYGYDLCELTLVNYPKRQACIVYYPGKLKQIHKSDFADIYCIPIGKSSYENKNGGTVKTFVFAASYIKKVK